MLPTMFPLTDHFSRQLGERVLDRCQFCGLENGSGGKGGGFVLWCGYCNDGEYRDAYGIIQVFPKEHPLRGGFIALLRRHEDEFREHPDLDSLIMCDLLGRTGYRAALQEIGRFVQGVSLLYGQTHVPVGDMLAAR